MSTLLQEYQIHAAIEFNKILKDIPDSSVRSRLLDVVMEDMCPDCFNINPMVDGYHRPCYCERDE